MENNLLEDRLNYHCTNQCKDYHEDGSCMKPMMCGFRTYMLATINDFHFYKKELELYKKAFYKVCDELYNKEDEATFVSNKNGMHLKNVDDIKNEYLEQAREELENGK